MTADAPASDHVALEISVVGLVQGVGFRPFVHRMAVGHGLCGWVRNEAGEVRIVVEGADESVQAFVDDLVLKAPPLARIDALERKQREPEYPNAFAIVPSADAPDRRSPISPDVAICDACTEELFAPGNKRYEYPFITCTDCGPRFTIIDAMPYDRERTSMGSFSQCPGCLTEYRTSDDRRYHSETNSCPDCGPHVWLEVVAKHPPTSQGPTTKRSGSEAIAHAGKLLLEGRIVAIRGLGGFHLAVDATNEAAVLRLRKLKNREAKPLALMVRRLEDAKALAWISESHQKELISPERPIVLAPPKENAGLAPSISPHLNSVGVMLAYTPLHHLLLDETGKPLVMTSGNRSEEPIAIDNSDARSRLGAIADAFLLHDREILARYDDSVVRIVDDAPVFLRRARGYAPLPLKLPIAAVEPLVAVGPHLKNTFTLVHGNTAYVSQHIGDLENLETLEHFERTVAAYKRLFRVEPKVVVRDLHPDYLSTRVAERMDIAKRYAIQHHHAHVAAVAAEHGVTEQVIGFAYDGTGYGDDGAVWGAETLIADLNRYQRICRLRYAPLPGGDLAARLPWRAALGYLSLEPSAEALFGLAFKGVDTREYNTAKQQIDRQVNVPLASSMGRLFDAAAAVLGVRRESHYEGQAAMELEALAGSREAHELPFPVTDGPDGMGVLDPLPLLTALGELRSKGRDVEELAAAFHESVALATAIVADRTSDETGLKLVVLGGGVFQNARLLSSVTGRLESMGLKVLVPRRLSPNDGAISYGQAAIAAAQMRAEVE